MLTPKPIIQKSISEKIVEEAKIEDKVEVVKEIFVPAELVPANWYITEKDSKFLFVNSVTGRKYEFNTIEEFNKLFRA